MNKKAVVILFLVSAANIVFFFYNISPLIKKNVLISPIGQESPSPTVKPLEKYSFENLKNRVYRASEITFDKILKQNSEFTSYLFFFESDGKKVSGLANIPNQKGQLEVIIMLRGFVPKQSFTSGEGTRRSAEAFAKKGFITLAPDFLGYGESASPSAHPMEERFETYTTALNLLSSVKNLNQSLTKAKISGIKAAENKIGLWGHSNGGHIALAVLEISGVNYPTVLWAPVSIMFPYSILYYTDEYDDHGKALRKLVADFEKDYDVEKYTITNYFDWIKAPIQLHQGGADEAVPQKWSDQLYQQLKKLGKEITYFIYPSENHNFLLGDWPLAISRSIKFYRDNLTID